MISTPLFQDQAQYGLLKEFVYFELYLRSSACSINS